MGCESHTMASPHFFNLKMADNDYRLREKRYSSALPLLFVFFRHSQCQIFPKTFSHHGWLCPCFVPIQRSCIVGRNSTIGVFVNIFMFADLEMNRFQKHPM